MTPERAAYHRLMLLAGLREEFDQELDHALETEDPITQPILDLAFCMSDPNQTLSVLYDYSLSHPVDDLQVYSMVMTELRRQYAANLLTPAQLVHIMYTIAQNHDDCFGGSWDQFRYPSYAYELLEDGLISEEVFQIAFEASFLHGQETDVWALEKEHRQTQKKKKPFLDFFRKRKEKEELS